MEGERCLFEGRHRSHHSVTVELKKEKDYGGLTLHSIYTRERYDGYDWQVIQCVLASSSLTHTNPVCPFLNKKAGPFQASFLKSRLDARTCSKETSEHKTGKSWLHPWQQKQKAETNGRSGLDEVSDFLPLSELNIPCCNRGYKRLLWCNLLTRYSSWANGHPPPHTPRLQPAWQGWLREVPDPPSSTWAAPALPLDGLLQNDTIIF